MNTSRVKREYPEHRNLPVPKPEIVKIRIGLALTQFLLIISFQNLYLLFPCQK